MVQQIQTTVIIPCLNEEGYVGRLLNDLCNQTSVPTAVIVVDCHSSDKTILAAQAYSKKLPLKILQTQYRSAASARNTGASRAMTDYLLSIDADMRLPTNFIETLTLRAIKKKADFVTPRFKPAGRHPFDRLWIGCISMTVIAYHMLLMRQVAGIGGGMLIRKSFHDKIGGYATALREFDDIDYIHYIHRLSECKPTFTFAWKAVAVVSNRREVSQGRFRTFLQTLPDNYAFVRIFIRPLMKKLGVKPKWHDIE